VGALALAAALLAFAAPASAQVRLSREADGDYSINVMSWWEIPFRSVVRQRYDFSCGSAAVATLLTHHYGRPTQEREVFVQMWRNGDQARIRQTGFSMLEMKTFLDSVGYQTLGVRLAPEEIERVGRPMIVLLNLNGYHHFVVVKGARGDRLLFGDPMLGLTQYSLADFGRMWNNIALIVARPPAGQRPSFNLASDWGPWSVAPLEQGSGGIRVAAGDLTTHLPPSYQIIPEILLDVRVPTLE